MRISQTVKDLKYFIVGVIFFKASTVSLWVMHGRFIQPPLDDRVSKLFWKITSKRAAFAKGAGHVEFCMV